MHNKKTSELIVSPICPHNFSFHTLSQYFLFHMLYNSSHLRTNSITFSSISEDKNRQHSLQANTRSGGDVRLFTLSESSRFRPVRTRSVKSFSLSNGDGKELRRDGDFPVSVNISRLITHEKILLNGDVPRRNGNVTYSVNRL